MIEHKTFHRYVVRAKQGARQSKADSRQSSARSVGAQLRRYGCIGLFQLTNE